MKKHIPIVICWLVNCFVIYIVQNMYPANIVFGNSWLIPFTAIFWLGYLITAFDHVSKHINKMTLHLKGRYKNLFYYFVSNTIFFWILARIPGLSGYGITKYTYAILLALFVTLGQWLTRQGLKKYKFI